MPNGTRLPVCPYFKYEKRKSIGCEDTYRSFDCADQKYSWMDMYCDSWDWNRCPYAMDLTEAYERYEKGDVKALEEHEVNAIKKELKSLTIKLGKTEKRVERQQKKIDELLGVNRSLVNINETLNKNNRRLHARWKELSEGKDAYEAKIARQVMGIADAYEARIAYLMDVYSCGCLKEEDVKEWLKDKNFAIVYDDKEDCFKLIFKEVSEDGQKDQDIQVEQQQE